MIFWHINDNMKFYMQKYDKRIYAVFYVQLVSLLHKC